MEKAFGFAIVDEEGKRVSGLIFTSEQAKRYVHHYNINGAKYRAVELFYKEQNKRD